MSFDLPSLDGTVAPAFTTAEACKRWLGDQTLTNPAFMQRQLTEQIDRPFLRDQRRGPAQRHTDGSGQGRRGRHV